MYIEPKGHRVWTEHYNSSHELTHITTSKIDNRDIYYLYKVVGDDCILLGKAKTPIDVEARYGLRSSEG